MKAQIIIAVMGVAAVSYLGFNMYVGTDAQQPTITSSQVKMIQIEPEVIVPVAEEPKEVKKKSVAEIVSNAKHMLASQQSLNLNQKFDVKEMEEYYDFITTSFPHLKEQIVDYRQAVQEQESRVEALTERISQRNKELIATGSSSSNVDDDLLYEQNQLIAQSHELGRKAMELNDAIRQAAYN